MGTQSDKLRNLVDNVYPVVVVNLTKGISDIDAQITEYNAQKTAIEWGMGEAETDQTTRIEAKGYDLNYYESTFGVSNLSSFHCGDLIVTTSLSYVDDDTFTIDSADGDMTSTFVNGLKLIINLGVDGYVIRTVDSSSYNTETEVVLVTDVSNPITSNIADVYELLYEYNGTGWDSDANIIANINYFSESYNHLTQPLGLSGTYGLNAKITQLGNGKSVLQADKVKYEDLIVLYDRFAT